MKAVLLVCVLLFLNIPVTNSSFCLCCSKKQERNALQNLLGEGTDETWLLVSTDCWLEPALGTSIWTGIKENGEKYEVKETGDIYKLGTIGAQVFPKDSCRVGLDNSRNHVINVIPKNDLDDEDFKECPLNGQDELQFHSFFLVYKEDKNTFMFLDPTKAKWFFTSDLQGCDVFVAIHPTKPDNPLVIHSNMNSIANEIENLEHKSESVDKIMTFVAEGYQLKARVYRKSESPDVSIYMKTYGETHNIQQENIRAYDMKRLDSDFYFFGYYTNSVWHFFMKAQKGGDTDFVL